MTKPLIDIEALRGKVLTSDGVAELLGITPDSIRRKIRGGIIAARKVPGKKSYTITGESLAAYLLGETPAPYIPERAIPPAPPRKAAEPSDPTTPPYKLPKTANTRLKLWIVKSHFTQKEVTEKTGIEGYKLSKILSGKYAITRPSLEALRAAYGDELITFLMEKP